MSKAKLRIEIVVEVEVKDLKNYEATTIEAAAENQKRWLESGDYGLEDLLSVCDSVTIVSVTGVTE